MNYLKTYTDAFAVESYSEPGHLQYDKILEIILNIKLDNNNIIDIGSGRGYLINILNNCKNILNNYSITSVDLNKFHNEPCDSFIVCDLSIIENRKNLENKSYDILICTDVLEHLEKNFIEDVLETYSKLSPFSILGIANHSDILNGVQLHTIIENDIYWDDLLKKYFDIIQKDTYYEGQFYLYLCKSLNK